MSPPKSPRSFGSLDPADEPGVARFQPVADCCGLSTLARRVALPSLAAIVTIAIASAAYLYGRATTPEPAPRFEIPVINATSSVTSEKFSMATGSVSDETEGLFVLDHNSGLLVCNVVYPRVGRFMAQFSVNVNDALGGGGKGGNYMMVTGKVRFQQQSNNPLADTVVYVLDTSTGAYAAYYVPYSRQLENARRPQNGALMFLSGGQANPVAVRDSN